MTFPARSNFASAGRDDAWWQIVDGATVWTCSTNGYSFVRLVQNTLRRVVTWTFHTPDGTNISGSNVVIDGKWGLTTARVLASALSHLDAPASLQTGLASEATLRRVGIWSITAAIWFMSRNGSNPTSRNLGVTDLRVPADVVPFTWVVQPPRPAGVLPNEEPVCAASTSAPPVATSPAVSQPTPVASPSTATFMEGGPSVVPTQQMPGQTSPLPTGVRPPVVVSSAGAPWIVVGGALMFVVAMGWLAFSNKPSRGRSPRKVRR